VAQPLRIHNAQRTQPPGDLALTYALSLATRPLLVVSRSLLRGNQTSFELAARHGQHAPTHTPAATCARTNVRTHDAHAHHTPRRRGVLQQRTHVAWLGRHGAFISSCPSQESIAPGLQHCTLPRCT